VKIVVFRDSFPNEKANVQAVLSEISTPNGKNRQTGEADHSEQGLFGRKIRLEPIAVGLVSCSLGPHLKVGAGYHSFCGLGFCDLHGKYLNISNIELTLDKGLEISHIHKSSADLLTTHFVISQGFCDYR
jgi:hypothetical protein